MMVVDENIEVVVGKFYNVRCAAITYRGNSGAVIQYVPIIGESHRDPQLGVDYSHYHIDGRFMAKGRPELYTVDNNGKTNKIISTKYLVDKGDHSFAKEITVKRRKCVRITTGIKPPTQAKKYNAWYATMIGKSCAGKKCPHLGTKMMEVDGKWVCPLHNLIGCPTTEKIITNEKQQQL